MEQIIHNMWGIWLVLIVLAIFSFFNFIIMTRLLKKHDESQIVISDAIELLNSERIKMRKDIDKLSRQGRQLNNKLHED